MLLIVTNQADTAVDFLIARLLRDERPYFRINSEDLATADLLSSLAEHAKLSIGPVDLDLHSVSSVWFRRAIAPSPPSAVAPSARLFTSGELRHIWEGVFASIEACWVNPIWATVQAERKLWQLHQARKVGFTTPRSLVTNQGDIARGFVSQAPSILKPVSHGLWDTGDRAPRAVLTREVTVGDIDDAALRLCPGFFQHAVPKGFDVRYTVIGRRAFAVAIRSQPTTSIDWRHPSQALQYEVISVPIEVERFSRTLMEKLALRYAAMDFVVTPANEWIYLEANPAGEWAWLEVELGLPLRSALVELFYGPQ